MLIGEALTGDGGKGLYVDERVSELHKQWDGVFRQQ